MLFFWLWCRRTVLYRRSIDTLFSDLRAVGESGVAATAGRLIHDLLRGEESSNRRVPTYVQHMKSHKFLGGSCCRRVGFVTVGRIDGVCGRQGRWRYRWVPNKRDQCLDHTGI